MKINRLQLKHKPFLESFLQKEAHSLSAFSFVNNFIWRDFFDFFWAEMDGNLCLFAKNNIGCFMNLPPIGGRINQGLIGKCFKIMDGYNLDKNISRIENIEEKDSAVFKKFGLELRQKDSEYIYQTKKLTGLSGDEFKAKRALCNYFIKNYQFAWEEFNPLLKNQCLKLYKSWSLLRKGKYKDHIYQAMLEDNLKVHKNCFDYYESLGLSGIVVKIKGEVKAYSLGFKLNQETFCILLEVADLSFKGLAQFIFREFCRKMSNFKLINAMDDSGLDNIKKTKLSYRPVKLIKSYIATRENV